MSRRSTRTVLLGLALGATTAALTARVAAPRRSARGGGLDGSGSHHHRVVVVGAGFGGLQAALRLAGQPGIDLTVVDRQNHHLFQPLLYQVATAALSPGDIAAPVREVLAPAAHSRVVRATVTGVDRDRRLVLCETGAPLPYDTLVLATGSEPSYFGHPEWAEDAPGLKTLDDALVLRNRVLKALESASRAETEAARRRALTFVLIGGGPTGVEMAGSIAELTGQAVMREFALAARPRIVLIDAGKRVLPEFAPHLSRYGGHALARMGVEVRTGLKVTAVEPGTVRCEGESFEADTVIWAAGTAATPVARWLGVQPGHGDRVPVGPDLRLAGDSAVFVIGDAALARGAGAKPLPGLAPVAKQQGDYVASVIAADVAGHAAPGPFAYRDYGTLAAIGRNKAVAQFGALHLSGLPAWMTWAVAHIFFLISFRNRVLVSAQWALAYATHQRTAGLILSAVPDHAPPMPPHRQNPGRDSSAAPQVKHHKDPR